MESHRVWTISLFALFLALPGQTAERAFNDPAMAVERIDPQSQSRAPEPGSARARALKALANAEQLTLISLQPWVFPDALRDMSDIPPAQRSDVFAERHRRSREQWCENQACFHDTHVLGRTMVAAQDQAEMKRLLTGALGIVPPYASACIPEYRHALSFVSAERRYDILLCYQCGQILVVAPDQETEGGQAMAMGDRRWLDTILIRTGVPLAKAASH